MHLPDVQRSDVDLLVTYSVSSEETIPIAIVEAFRRIEPALTEQETVVQDWIDGEAIEQLHQGSGRNLRISTIIWDHPVIIKPKEIQIFDDRTSGSTYVATADPS